MRPRLLAAIVLLLGIASIAKENSHRPPIYGIAHVRIRVNEFEGSLAFYQGVLGLAPENQSCRDSRLKCYRLNSEQLIQLDISETPLPKNYVEEVAFLTSDVSSMREYLLVHGLQPGAIEKNAEPVSSVSVSDPEGHRIVFEQRPKEYLKDYRARVSTSLIHAGIVVRDRAAEDRFYKDILGFHLYWQGGRKDDQASWVNMQVPDGTDWIEYMLNVSPNADRRELGVMNHIALGVPDIKAAREQLIKNGWKPGEEPKIGRGGKWQLNLYDPDDTRVEFMEFTPVQKPCCSEYTGPHPGQKR